MAINSRAGKGLVTDDSLNSMNSITPSSPVIQKEIGEVIQTAESNLDLRNVKIKAKKELAVQRTYQITLSNIKRLELLLELQGADYSWQINKALEHWFANVHPEIKL